MSLAGQRHELTPWDAESEYRIERSQTPVSEDGYKKGEPKYLACQYCEARVLLTPDPEDPGVDDLAHDRDCPNRFARSHWFRDQL